MVPDVDIIKFGIEAWEEILNEDGWDQDPQLMCGLMPPQAAALVLMPVPVQPAEIHPHLPTALKSAVDLFESDQAGELLAKGDLLRHDTFVGYFVMSEGYMSPISEEERAGRNLADVPGAMEIRQVMGVDTGGRSYWLHRVRGEEPTTIVAKAGDNMMTTGPVVESLIRLVKATGRHAPADSRDLPALNALYRQVRERSQG